jgi:hypothetical protein
MAPLPGRHLQIPTDSVAGGTFMGMTLGEATKLINNMMTNYSQWHTKRAPTGKKVNSVEEVSTLSDKMDALMNMLTSKNAHVDPNGVPLSTLIERNNDAIDVKFSLEIISTTMLIEGISILGRTPAIPLIIMEIPMEIYIIIIIGCLLNMRTTLKNLLFLKIFLMPC